MQSHARSLVNGTTANDRRVIAAAVAANSAPTASEQGISIQLFDAIDCVARCTGGGGSYDLRVWWYYNAADVWVFDDDLGTVAVSTAGGIEVFPILNQPNSRAANAVYIEVLNFAGGGVANVWLSGRGGVQR